MQAPGPRPLPDGLEDCTCPPLASYAWTAVVAGRGQLLLHLGSPAVWRLLQLDKLLSVVQQVGMAGGGGILLWHLTHVRDQTRHARMGGQGGIGDDERQASARGGANIVNTLSVWHRSPPTANPNQSPSDQPRPGYLNSSCGTSSSCFKRC